MILQQGEHRGIQRGRAEGRLQTARTAILKLGRVKFGTEPPADVQDALVECHDPDRLERMFNILLTASQWTDLLEA